MSTTKAAPRALPTLARPQALNLGQRPRVRHLPALARVSPTAGPINIPDGHNVPRFARNGPATKGLTYRNSAFQALLNTPMFVNFTRAHQRQRKQSEKKCPLGLSCLVCATARVCAYYWNQENYHLLDQPQALGEEVNKLWQLCLKLFWGPDSQAVRKVGPVSKDDEYWAESFLLHFLTEMQRQLEASPGEYQTFNQMFTIDTTYRWKCSLPACDWTSTGPTWERSMYLHMDVQKHIGRSVTTEPLRGVECALTRRAHAWGAKRDVVPKCPVCASPTVPRADIINFPEVMILVRNIDSLPANESPDIPYDGGELNFKQFTLNRTSSDQAANVTYELVAGTAERRRNRFQYSSAFARGGRIDSSHRWWFMDEAGVTEVLDYAAIDRLQRQWLGEDAVTLHEPAVLPEMLICARTDYNQMQRTDSENLNKLLAQGWASPVELDEKHRERDYLARSVTDIFAQPIGNGLLKFKITLTPADPAPTNSIPFSLDIGYEFNGCQWALSEKIKGRLLPASEINLLRDLTPNEKETHARFHVRSHGNSVSARGVGSCALQDASASWAGECSHGNETSFGQYDDHASHEFASTGVASLNNPFGLAGQLELPTDFADVADDIMELEPSIRSSFFDQPHVQKYIESTRNREIRNALDQYTSNTRLDFRKENGNKNDRKRENKNQSNNWKNNKNNNNSNNSNNNGENKKAHWQDQKNTQRKDNTFNTYQKNHRGTNRGKSRRGRGGNRGGNSNNGG